MRQLTHYFPGCAYTTTEMMSAHQLVYGKHQQKRFYHKDPSEQIVCYQLSGRCEDILKQATNHCEQLGADIIDLNCGCPQPKIRKKQQGSKQIEDPEKLYRLIKAMRSATSLPLTAKIRLLPPGKGDNLIVIEALIKAGVDAITVHARTWRDDYDVACDWASVRTIVDNSSVPIIANGSITSTKEALDVFKITGADGLMLSRVSLGRPWIFKEILENKPQHITQVAKADLLIEHLSKLSELEGEFKTLLQARSLVKYYLPALADQSTQSSLEALYQVIRQYSHHN